MKTTIDNLEIPYEARSSDRAKYPRIDFRQGRFVVVVPSGLRVQPKDLLNDQSDWVVQQRKSFLKAREDLERDISENGHIRVLGKNKRIVVESRRSNSVEEDIFLAEHLVERNGVKPELEKTLREYARHVFNEKLENYSDRVNGDYERVFIRDQQTRWGSCSSNNNLNFNWRLVLAPEHVLEYVVVHELVHLDVSNHGQDFWRNVERVMPTYEKGVEWLDRYSARLVF